MKARDFKIPTFLFKQDNLNTEELRSFFEGEPIDFSSMQYTEFTDECDLLAKVDQVLTSKRKNKNVRNALNTSSKTPELEKSQKQPTGSPLLSRITESAITILWNPLPKVNFKVAQRLLRILIFPQVGWEAYNDSPYQLRVRIEVHPILGNRDLHPLSDNHINGKSVYPVEPNSPVFTNGCFTLPTICATSNGELILEIRAAVEDINDPKKGKYKLIPRRWKYNRISDTWSYHPQELMPE